MSFKRAGDDHCALRLQKKQRVGELFAEDIPANEVSQTRNGRFVCLVCPHNPVLDTMPMLSIHRQGKRHLTNMTIKFEKQQDLSELLQKRKQELYMKEASVNNKQSNTAESGSNLIPSNDTSETTPLLAKTRQLTEGVMRSGNTNINKSQVQERINEKPRPLSKKNKPFFQSKVEMKLSRDFNEDFQKNSLSSSTLDNTTNNKNGHQSNIGEEKLQKERKNILFSSALAKDKNVKPNVQTRPIVRASDGQQVGTTCTAHSKQISGREVTNTEESSGQNINREKQKRYLQLRTSGWIWDSSGKWMKDENAEFDSDEDEPALTK